MTTPSHATGRLALTAAMTAITAALVVVPVSAARASHYPADEDHGCTHGLLQLSAEPYDGSGTVTVRLYVLDKKDPTSPIVLPGQDPYVQEKDCAADGRAVDTVYSLSAFEWRGSQQKAETRTVPESEIIAEHLTTSTIGLAPDQYSNDHPDNYFASFQVPVRNSKICLRAMGDQTYKDWIPMAESGKSQECADLAKTGAGALTVFA